MKVTFLPNCKTIEANENKRLMDIAIENEINIGKDLCTRYKCGQCKVMISKGNDKDYSDSEQRLLTDEERVKGIRLACCVKVKKEDMTIILLNKEEKTEKVNKIKTENKKENKKKEDEKKGSLRINNYIEEDTLKNKCNKKVNVVIDLGTTTIEAVIIEAVNDDIIDRIKFKNPQRIIGADVITRLTYGYKNDYMITKLVIESLNKCLRRYKFIDKILIVGNSTMIHLLMLKDISKLAVAPFKSNYMAGEIVQANKIGLDVNDKVKLVLPPLIGAHVGSDAYACIYDVLMDNEKNSMVIDIGTNSEILLNKRGHITTCSTAAGSAFEGMAVRCGRSCGNGVVKNVKPVYDKKNKLIDLDLGIDNPSGLCASAVIDLLAILLENDFIDRTGRLKDNIFTKRLNFTQDDIRNLQLAKSAIVSAIKILLDEEKLLKSDNEYNIDVIYLAGAFGKNINIENAIKIGLLPDLSKKLFVQIGNSALKGAVKLLKVNLKEMLKISKDIYHLELAQNSRFGEIYIKNIDFNI